MISNKASAKKLVPGTVFEDSEKNRLNFAGGESGFRNLR